MSREVTTEEISGMVRYDTACRAIAAAVSIDEIQEFRNKSEAMRAYAKQAKNKRLEVQAAEIRFRAERRIGELMAAQRDAGLMAPPGRPDKSIGFKENPIIAAPTLAEIGVDKNLAARARKLAAIPAATFDDVIDDWRGRVSEETDKVTVELFSPKKKSFVENNTGNNEWYTPPDIIVAARKVLGGFGLDPASSGLANKTVKADLIYTAEDDGLSQDWPKGSIWMNPPYAQPLMGQFATKYAKAIQAGSTGIVLVNNATETAWFQEILSVSVAVCFHKSRIRFVGEEGQSGAPLQGQAIIYAGQKVARFEEAFKSFGIVLVHP